LQFYRELCCSKDFGFLLDWNNPDGTIMLGKMFIKAEPLWLLFCFSFFSMILVIFLIIVQLIISVFLLSKKLPIYTEFQCLLLDRLLDLHHVLPKKFKLTLNDISITLERNCSWIEFNFYNFVMTCQLFFDFLISWILFMSSCISWLNFMYSFYSLYLRLNAPKTASPDDSWLHIHKNWYNIILK
jgi:hypothetical protein